MNMIFGELHTEIDRIRVNRMLEMFNKVKPFDYLLLEEIGPFTYTTEQEKLKAIRNKKYNVGPLGLKLSIALGIPAVGIDLWDDDVYKDDVYDGEHTLDSVRSFQLREDFMVLKITEYSALGNVAVIVGDTHLRTVKSKQLGRVSPLQTFFGNNKDFAIVRARKNEIK